MEADLVIVNSENQNIPPVVNKNKVWQWLYKTKNSPLWDITPMYLSKRGIIEYVENYNAQIQMNPIVDYGRAKITKSTK
ncbi:MAG: hypothetical protein KBC41_00780 [Candidatus Pacebacteria bacterium]|nr:hypothetical protein [Candidatus Paceibacterota bacterium]MBP9866598.1 hypothetical protein [Candidatus Paceibacterota bacterium]